MDENVNNLIESWDKETGKRAANSVDNVKVYEENSIPRMDNGLNEEISSEDLKVDVNNADKPNDSSFPAIHVQENQSLGNDLVEVVSDSTVATLNSEEVKQSNTIPSFPDFILPSTSAKNKTLEFLDLWNYDESCTKHQVR